MQNHNSSSYRYIIMNYLTAAQKRKRKELGLNRINNTIRNSSLGPVPENGGTKGYDVNYRRAQLNSYEEGFPIQASTSSI